MIWLTWWCRWRVGWWAARDGGGSRAGCLIAVAWLLRQPEDAVTVPELAGLYRSARR